MPTEATGQLTLRLFGPFEARQGSAPLTGLNEHRKGAPLLALLALYADKTLSNEWVATQLWPDTGSTESLGHVVPSVRRALGPFGGRLTAKNGTLCLDLSEADVDIAAFDRAWESAESDPAALEQAIALYRGPLLLDWADEWVEAARKDYVVKFLDALETLAENALRSKNYGAARRWLERRAEARPGDHAPRCKLMAVLMQCEEYAAAKDLYEAYRDYLRGVLGLLPPRRMTELYARIPRTTPGVVPDLDPEAVELEPVGGAVPLGSKYYVARPADREFHTALARRDSILLIQGPRQVGKTSLLARGLEQARQEGADVLLTDLQAFSQAEMASPEAFFLALAQSVARELQQDIPDQQTWNPLLAPGANFEMYFQREALGRREGRLVWGIDEADRVFPCAFRNEVFGLFRSWHNRRALAPHGPWGRLTLILAYATEAHLFITDLNQSPFNVGTGVTLRDFTPEQVAELNRMYGSPLREEEVKRLLELVGGQPFLVRRALYEMRQNGLDFAAIAAQAEREDGLFSGPLRRMRAALCRDSELTEAVRALLRGLPCPSEESFFRLSAAGIAAGESAQNASLRCKLYQAYLARHLLRETG